MTIEDLKEGRDCWMKMDGLSEGRYTCSWMTVNIERDSPTREGRGETAGGQWIFKGTG